jgi:hypothetical protein
VLAACTLVFFGVTVYFQEGILGGIPHIPDSAIYYRQAILLRYGLLEVPHAPALPVEAFQANGSVITKSGAILYQQANHFWPALLALGIALGIPSLVNVLCAAGAVVMIFLVGRELFSPRVGLVAAFCHALSPFSILMAGDFMQHPSTQLFLTAGLYLLLRFARTGDAWSAAGAGAALAIGFAIRQLTAIGLLAPFLIGLAFWRWRDLRRKNILWLAVGGSAVAAVMGYDHYVITGSPFGSPHRSIHNLFLSPDNVPQGLSVVSANLGHLLLISFGGPLRGLLLGLAAAGVLLRPSTRTGLLAGSFLGLVAVHSLMIVHGLHGYGPRFLSEGSFAIAILAAVALETMWQQLGARGRAAFAICVVSAVGANLRDLARILPNYRHYNGINTRLFDALAQLNDRRRVVIVSNNSWQDMDIGATLFDPYFRGLIFVHELPDGRHEPAIRGLGPLDIYEVIGGQVRLRAAAQGWPHASITTAR